MKLTHQLFTASLLLVTHQSQAASVAWTSASFTDANQISTAGTLVEARNLGQGTNGANGATPTASVTVNGVVFSSSTGSQYTDAAAVGTFRDAGNYSGATITGLTAGETDDLLDTLEFGGGVGNSTVTLSGLTIGLEYTVQVLFARNQNPANNIDLGHALTVGGAEVYTLNDVAYGNGAHIATGTFTADATSQELHFASSAAGNAEFNALQLRVVPEPSSAALLGLGGLALILRRRK